MSETFELHVVGLPHTQLTSEYDACAYTAKARRFATMMADRGHHVVAYGGEADWGHTGEHVSIISRETQAFLGFRGPQDYLELDYEDEGLWGEWNRRAAEAIGDRIEEGGADLRPVVGIVSGSSNQSLVDQLHDRWPLVPVVELGIGYKAPARGTYRVFESHAWRHYVYGREHRERGDDRDVVIPNFYDERELPTRAVMATPDRALFVGRAIEPKGIELARAAAAAADVELEEYGHGTVAGMLTHEVLLEKMAAARCLLVPTRYVGPFEGVHVEAMLVGCPVVTSNFGVFTETVMQGVDGYRCSTLDDWVLAIELSRDLDRAAIAKGAREQFTFEAASWRYAQYFERVLDEWGGGRRDE